YGGKGEVPDEEYTIPLGKANVLQQGEDATIVSISRGVEFSMEAAKKLEKEGIQVEVIDMRSLNPLDEETVIQSVQKTNRLIIAHEAVRSYGWGAELASVIQEDVFDCLDAPIYRIGADATPIPY